MASLARKRSKATRLRSRMTGRPVVVASFAKCAGQARLGMPRRCRTSRGGSFLGCLLHECGDVSAVSLSVLGELVRRGAAFLEGLADGIWICSGAVPERAASMIVLAGL